VIGLFQRTRRGIEGKLARRGATVLGGLFGELLALLEPAGPAAGTADPLEALVGTSPGGEEPGQRPDDPVLARLLPDAYADDGAAREFRRLTQDELLRGKISRLRAALADLAAHPDGHLVLDEDRAEVWLGALEDLRLAVGARMGLRADPDPTPADAGPAAPPLGQRVAYEWLGLLQETLVEALAGDG
jgi:hypothetical protein